MEIFPVRLGGVVIRKVEEAALPLHPGEFFKTEACIEQERLGGPSPAIGTPSGHRETQDFQDVAALVNAVEWLAPHYMDEEGNLNLRVQMYVIETPGGKRIAVDTCMGNDKDLGEECPVGHMRSGPFLQKLSEAGCPPESVDVVVCTHLHWDHVGFNTVKVDGAWVPTFPQARYLIPRLEWAYWQEELASGRESFQRTDSVFEESLRPVLDAGLVQLVEAPCVVAEEAGVRVSLRPTPGHSPGHVSVVVEADGQSAIITGDCIHHPAQVAHPSLGTFYDSCSSEACETRRSLLKDAAERRALLIGTHFAVPSAGYVQEDAQGSGHYRFLPMTCQPCRPP